METSGRPSNRTQYGFLTSDQIKMIDEALASLGGYGEVRLIVKKGTLRFLVTQQSHDALKWRSKGTDPVKFRELNLEERLDPDEL